MNKCLITVTNSAKNNHFKVERSELSFDGNFLHLCAKYQQQWPTNPTQRSAFCVQMSHPPLTHSFIIFGRHHSIKNLSHRHIRCGHSSRQFSPSPSPSVARSTHQFAQQKKQLKRLWLFFIDCQFHMSREERKLLLADVESRDSRRTYRMQSC